MSIFSKQEELIMLSVFRLREDACLMTVRKDLKNFAGKDWAFGSLYVALERLQKKACITSTRSKPTPEKGGKAVRYYTLTREGIEALKNIKQMNDTMWKEFSEFTFKSG